MQITVRLGHSSRCRHSLLVARWQLETSDWIAATSCSHPRVPSKVGISDVHKSRRRFNRDGWPLGVTKSVNVTVSLSLALTGPPSERRWALDWRSHLERSVVFFASIDRQGVQADLVSPLPGSPPEPARLVVGDQRFNEINGLPRQILLPRSRLQSCPAVLLFSERRQESQGRDNRRRQGPTSAGEQPSRDGRGGRRGRRETISLHVSDRSRHALAAARIAVV
ncbi:hypothetical protein ABH991_001483 [Bradyrhizobium ottawaense]|uniref:Uncharacterized protein n=1 Tax=Bradyrhizobium ottawaense TaxID=931866 RepID=A0ABV4FP92_9BRAD